jgi:ParB-like nuclease domain
MSLTAAQRELLAGLSQEVKRATARAYRDGWQRGGDRLGHPAAVQMLQHHGFELEDRPRGSSSHHLRSGANGAKVDVAAATMRNFGSANRRPDVNARHRASSSQGDWCRNLYPNTAGPRREPYIEVGYYACPERMCASIARFGFLNPILIDGQRRVIAGHARLEAARRLGLEAVPTLAIEGLSKGDLRLFAIAENRIAELAGWDKTLLAHELRFISELEIDVDLTLSGFAAA